MNENKRITISLSPGLARMRLSELTGHGGIILEDLTGDDRRDKSYMVQLYRLNHAANGRVGREAYAYDELVAELPRHYVAR